MMLKYLLVVALTFSVFTVVNAQVIIDKKPVAPVQAKQLKAPKDDSYLLVPAEWATKGGEYVYVQPRYVKERPGFKYIPGKWKKVKGGWAWKPAVWKAV